MINSGRFSRETMRLCIRRLLRMLYVRRRDTGCLNGCKLCCNQITIVIIIIIKVVLYSALQGSLLRSNLSQTLVKQTREEKIKLVQWHQTRGVQYT